MKKVVEVKNLSVEINDKNILNNVTLNFFEGVHTFLCGTSASGKTMLLKAINQQVEYLGEVNCSEKVSIIYDKLNFTSNSVEDELKFLSLSPLQKEFIANFFDEQTLKINPNNLSFYEQKLLILCSAIYQNPKIVFIDNLYSFLKKDDIKKFNKYFTKNKITVVLVSNDIEESLNYKYMIVMDKGIVAIEGKTEQVLKEEKILKRLGIGLPFYVDLSTQLQYYNLLDKVYLNKKELVDKLWK